MNSKIILASGINLDKSYTDVLNYTESQMLALCNQNAVATANNYSFIRDRGTIQTGFTYSQALQSNYIAFQNPDYNNKWFFAFIDKVIYKGDKNTEIEYTIDSWSTWFDYWTEKKCFVSRHHVNNDTIGLNTVPENLDVGDVVQEGEIEDISLSDIFWIAVSTSWTPTGSSGGEQFSGVSLYNKQVSGNRIILFQINYASDIVDLGLYLIRTNSDGHIADVKDIFIVPDAVVDKTAITEQTATVSGNTFTFYTLPYTFDIREFTTTFAKQTTFTDYTPKNNKCFVYPYNYLLVSNNIGNYNIYKYENFYGSNNVVFKTQLVLNVGCSGRLVPYGYKLQQMADDESIPLAKYPTCGWSADSFVNWLTQEAVNQSTSLAFGLFGGGNQYQSDISNINQHNQKVIETGKGDMLSSTNANVSLGTNIAGTIAKQIGNFYSASLLPNIQGGQNTGSVNFGAGRNTFTFRKMRVKTEYLKIIDDYFTRFGYKINKLEIPNITGRRYWNYVEIGSSENIGYGDVPSSHMEIINNACRRGVTIWHNHSNIGNYSLNNEILS